MELAGTVEHRHCRTAARKHYQGSEPNRIGDDAVDTSGCVRVIRCCVIGRLACVIISSMGKTTIPRFRFPSFAVLALPLLAQDAILERARQVNLERAASMPNFVVDEIDNRYTAPLPRSGPVKWKHLDTLESEVTVRGIVATRVWRTGTSRLNLGFWPAAGGFGTELRPLFSPECPTQLTPAGHEALRGRAVSVYRFSSPAGGCFGPLFSHLGRDQYNAARIGRVFLDDASDLEVQYEEEAAGFPPDFGWYQRNETVLWDNVAIGGAPHWLPVSAEFLWRSNDWALHRVVVEYKNHRHFEAGSRITYK